MKDASKLLLWQLYCRKPWSTMIRVGVPLVLFKPYMCEDSGQHPNNCGCGKSICTRWLDQQPTHIGFGQKTVWIYCNQNSKIFGGTQWKNASGICSDVTVTGLSKDWRHGHWTTAELQMCDSIFFLKRNEASVAKKIKFWNYVTSRKQEWDRYNFVPYKMCWWIAVLCLLGCHYTWCQPEAEEVLLFDIQPACSLISKPGERNWPRNRSLCPRWKLGFANEG